MGEKPARESKQANVSIHHQYVAQTGKRKGLQMHTKKDNVTKCRWKWAGIYAARLNREMGIRWVGKVR